MGRMLVASNGNDRIYTPNRLADAIVKHIRPDGKCFDPCAGQGAFIRAFRNFGNPIQWCEIDKGRDFFHCTYSDSSWLITNPPFSKITKFLKHAIELGIPNIALLCTINAFWMNGKLNLLQVNGYQITELVIVESPYFRQLNNWPQSGFSLGVIIIETVKSRYPVSRNLKVSYLNW